MATMTEIELLDKIDSELQAVFDLAVEARDNAQAAIVAVKAIKEANLKRKIELQRAELAEIRK